MKDQVKAMAKRHKLFGESDESVDKYVDAHYHKFYLYVADKKLRGYCDYFIYIDKNNKRVLFIYDFVCEGDVWRMFKFYHLFCKENNIDYIEFKKHKQKKDYKLKTWRQ